MTISPMTSEDFQLFWPEFEAIISAQETYAYDPNMTYAEAYALWCESPQRCFVAKEGEEVLGTYYLKPNGMGPSSHVCNCGYMVSMHARGKGVARALCEHSQEVGRVLGYHAMQFNAVVSANAVAVALWQTLGFAIVGTIPKGYKHGKLGYVNTYVMYKEL
ncbi:GNAT family N-acetyltransferase [Sulfurospirillum sp. T05]|uniref:GNAT family N-acetyltransferase n=1 Tax=Sulfurospirillum tamanense TaxID=2813362 RepID=A0ABS2WNY3_9BACT|nr:GNAT family N-acetyltransferase [Sulfurospirillum tamanensis]MBN2963374.1 GNAT family N-acetyltransferase [Sulfurospirillum tamanensis]